MVQLHLNQGPQDALLYDNNVSYFTNVGYTRTSNFQVEYREVEPQNSAALGSTVQFVIPKAADLLGAVDLRVTLKKPVTGAIAADNNAVAELTFAQWVDEVGFAMIEKATFSVGSNDIESITGDQMQLKNELMTSDEQRLGFEHVLKTGKPATYNTKSSSTGWGHVDVGAVEGFPKVDLPGTSADKHVNKDYTRMIVCSAGNANGIKYAGDRQLIIPLSFFFTKHVSQYFPLAAVAGCNDIRISIKFRPLKELIQTVNVGDGAGPVSSSSMFAQGAAIDTQPKLMCHYVHVTGPEATTLMNKEHVRLMKLWQHQHKDFTRGDAKWTLDLSFLHPVSTLLITVRRVKDMTGEELTVDAAQKGYFFYHGDGTNPNYDSEPKFNVKSGTSEDATTPRWTPKIKNIALTLNGQERHPGLNEGIDVEYLNARLLPMLHSNSNSYQKQMLARAPGPAYYGQQHGLMGSKNIFVYPFSLNPEGSNPSGAVNFSKVSHAKLTLSLEPPATTDVGTDTALTRLATAADVSASVKNTSGSAATTAGTDIMHTPGTDDQFRVDVYGLYYNWLQIKDGRALLSFA